jgi:adenylate cyclase
MTHRILVVDDYELNLALISRILELNGYQLKLARSGEEAIQAVEQGMPDLAILDVMMPNMDGFELCQKLRQPPINATIPIILLTAMSTEVEKHRATQAGANDIWSKPFEMEQFLRRIKELLGIEPAGNKPE